jgi:hypothetical protein
MQVTSKPMQVDDLQFYYAVSGVLIMVSSMLDMLVATAEQDKEDLQFESKKW